MYMENNNQQGVTTVGSGSSLMGAVVLLLILVIFLVAGLFITNRGELQMLSRDASPDQQGQIDILEEQVRNQAEMIAVLQRGEEVEVVGAGDETSEPAVMMIGPDKSIMERYTSGRVSFEHPAYVDVSVRETNNERRYTLFEVDENGEAVGTTPFMYITVSDAAVTFQLWEGVAWEYFDEVVSTFELRQ